VLRETNLLYKGLTLAKVLARGRDQRRRRTESGRWTYAGNISGQSFYFSLFKRAVRKAGEDVFCVEFVKSGD